MEIMMNYKVVLIVGIVIYLVAVSVYSDITQPKNTAIIRATTESVSELISHSSAPDIDRLPEFALLSAAAYEEQSYAGLAEGSAKYSGLWKLALESHTQSLIKLADAENISGFSFQIYHRTVKSLDNKEVYAVVFRGTDEAADIMSNLHWFTRFLPGMKDQYDFVREHASDIVDVIHASSSEAINNIEIISTGHSLGGGLAQQAAYATDGISTVFAYAPSSVTGFYDVDKKRRDDRKKKIRIYRIHERGEILAYLRRVMKALFPVVPVNPKIVEIRFNFQNLSGTIFSFHKMVPLAKSLMQSWEDGV